MHRFLKSLLCAWAGLRVLCGTQRHARIHALATLGAVAAGFGFQVGLDDWCWLSASIAAVWTAEAFNTALEFLADEVSLEQRERIGHAKDLGAAAVLCAALGAIVIGGIIFTPHVARVLER